MNGNRTCIVGWPILLNAKTSKVRGRWEGWQNGWLSSEPALNAFNTFNRQKTGLKQNKSVCYHAQIGEEQNSVSHGPQIGALCKTSLIKCCFHTKLQTTRDKQSNLWRTPVKEMFRITADSCHEWLWSKPAWSLFLVLRFQCETCNIERSTLLSTCLILSNCDSCQDRNRFRVQMLVCLWKREKNHWDNNRTKDKVKKNSEKCPVTEKWWGKTNFKLTLKQRSFK